MKRYEFWQNNSGGHHHDIEWTGPEDRGGVDGHNVWVMAESASEANELAEKYAGVYFHGVELGIDCECCGDRWYEQRMDWK